MTFDFGALTFDAKNPFSTATAEWMPISFIICGDDALGV
jgi:hypothetical protein